jgi:hypothetical protein
MDNEFGRDMGVACFKAISCHLTGGTEENYEKSQSGYSVSEPNYEPRNSCHVIRMLVRQNKFSLDFILGQNNFQWF